jgi:hypothetical protein
VADQQKLWSCRFDLHADFEERRAVDFILLTLSRKLMGGTSISLTFILIIIIFFFFFFLGIGLGL